MSTGKPVMNGGTPPNRKQLCLRDFGISEKTGFIPEDPPLSRLSHEAFFKWEQLMDQLPNLIKVDELLLSVCRQVHW